MKSIITSALVLLALLLPAAATAADFVVDGIYYNITDSITVEVTKKSPGGVAYHDHVVIPATVTHNDTAYAVTAIGEMAFAYCDNLVSVDIPNSVTTIGEWAFFHCNGLTDLAIGSAVTTIGTQAFAYCKSLASVEIPNSVTTLGWGAFAGCSSLSSVDIPSSVTAISDWAFYICGNLASVTIPSSVTSIGSYAFYRCSSLASVDIPNGVTAVGEWAFHGCKGLTSVTIPNSVTRIADYVFSGCSGMTSVTIPHLVTSIGQQAFANCSSLVNVTIPKLVATIGDEAFVECHGLTDVYSQIADLARVTAGNRLFFLKDGDYSNRTLHVALGVADAYRNDERWYPYFDQFVEAWVTGDVNGDGEVNIADINAIIDIVLNDKDYDAAADVNGDGEINIADINAVIGIILGGDEEPGEEYVDLGLPSGTLWATRNIGATRPEDNGNYYSWGEITPKEYYHLNTYKWCNGSDTTLTKYCTDSEHGTVDGKTELDPEDDVAYAIWGPSWRMPTSEQQKELFDLCTWTWTTRNNVNGYQVTGPNGKSIFMPAAGWRNYDTRDDVGSYGFYWSRTLYSDHPSDACGLGFDSEKVNWYMCTGYRYFGFSVRAVRVSQD